MSSVKHHQGQHSRLSLYRLLKKARLLCCARRLAPTYQSIRFRSSDSQAPRIRTFLNSWESGFSTACLPSILGKSELKPFHLNNRLAPFLLSVPQLLFAIATPAHETRNFAHVFCGCPRPISWRSLPSKEIFRFLSFTMAQTPYWLPCPYQQIHPWTA